MERQQYVIVRSDDLYYAGRGTEDLWTKELKFATQFYFEDARQQGELLESLGYFCDEVPITE